MTFPFRSQISGTITVRRLVAFGIVISQCLISTAYAWETKEVKIMIPVIGDKVIIYTGTVDVKTSKLLAISCPNDPGDAADTSEKVVIK